MGRGRGRPRRGSASASGSGRKRPLQDVDEEELEVDAGEDLDGEDFCFVCKDGGALRVCDYRGCNKAYHPVCVGKDNDFLSSEEEFICEWHTCNTCKRRSRYYCFCCPRHAFCNGCVAQAEFVPVLRKTKGFCIDCLRMAIMIEKNVDVDSDGEMADFNDRETYEFLFKDYWAIVKDKEGLTLEKLEEAYTLMKKGLNCKQAVLEKVSDEERTSESDFTGNSDDGDEQLCSPSCSKGASKKRKTFLKEGSIKGSNMNWCSETLMKFLSSVGRDTKMPLDQFGAAQVVKEYIQENDLLQKDKKKLVTCDDNLKSLFRRSKLRYNRICSLLKKHITSNMASEDETVTFDDNNDSAVTKKHLLGPMSRTSKHTSEIDKRCFASLESDNIKLVYLKRSLVLNLLKESDTFESKVTGCFVRVKIDPKDYIYHMHKKYHQLGQVTGIRKSSEVYKIRDISTDVLLCVSNLSDIRISMLSDEDFEKDECEDLLLLAQKGSFKRPTVGELEEKVRSIHRDIVNHWIDKEIQKLKGLIDLANVKGWRLEMRAHMDKKKLLCEPSERQRRLEEVPRVIPDMKDSKDIKLQVLAQDESIQNNTVAVQASKKDADGGTVGMNVQKQDTEDTEANAAVEIPWAPEQCIACAPKQKCEATKADANGETSATHIQMRSTEANKSDAAGDTSRKDVQKKDDKATKAYANGETSATHVQMRSTEANKSDAAADTPRKDVQKKDEKGNELNALEDCLNDYGVFANVDIVFDEDELSDSDDNEQEPEIANHRGRLNDVTHQQRQEIYEALLERSNNGNLQRDSTTIVANLFNVSLRTVQRVWHRAKGCRQRGEPVDVSSKKPKHSGKKKKAFDLSSIAAIPLHKRSTIRKLASELGVSKSWLHRQLKIETAFSSSVSASEATKADANGETSATHVQMRSTEANKSDAAGDTPSKDVRKKGDKAVDAGMKTPVIIDLGDDDDDDAGDAHPVQPETSETLSTFQRRGTSLHSCRWYYVDPQGEEQGPFKTEDLRRWWDDDYFPEDFKVWREGETSDSAVFLRDVL